MQHEMTQRVVVLLDVLFICGSNACSIYFFLLGFLNYYSLLLLVLELLQWQFITWLQAPKHTRMHNPDVNLKTHVQGNQVCGVASHGTNLVLQSNLVCVCMCSQDLKWAVKQALELFTPSFLWSFRFQNFTTYNLFLVSLFLHLHCC
jgi:hypothetical protein